MPRPAPHVLAILLATLALGAAGCGGEDATPEPRTAPGSTQADPAPEPDAEDADDDVDAPPSPAAQATDRRFDRLVAAYAPVSSRVNFLVAAETLRADAVDSDAGEDIERERAGVVRVENERLKQELLPARTAVLAAAVDSEAERLVQQSMLEAIDARLRSTGELAFALKAAGNGSADTVVDQRFETWRASWDASLRAAREATTTMQVAREERGLEPAPEEAIR